MAVFNRFGYEDYLSISPSLWNIPSCKHFPCHVIQITNFILPDFCQLGGRSFLTSIVVVVVVVVVIIIIIIIIISFMQGAYTHILVTNYVPREHSVAAILLFLFRVLISLLAVLNLLYFYISTFRSMCAVPNMAVFCSSLTSRFPGILLTYFLNDFEIVLVAPIITGITFVFTFYVRYYSRCYYYYYYYYYVLSSQNNEELRQRVLGYCH